MIEKNLNDDKIIGFEQDAEFYYRLAKNAVEQQNYLTAIEYVNRAIKKENSVESLMLKAEILHEMDLIEESNNEYYKALLLDSKNARIYMLLANNYLIMDMHDATIHCIKKGALNDMSNEDDDDIDFFEEFFTLEKSEQGGSPEHKELLDMARTCMRLEQMQEVLQILRFIPQTSDYYLEAQNTIAFCYLVLDEYNNALDTIKNILRVNADDVYAKCTLVSVYRKQKKVRLTKQAIADLEQYEDSDADDLIKIALTFCELNMHTQASRFFNLYYKKQPFDIDSRIFGAIANYNCGQQKKASEIIKIALRIEPNNSVLQYYADFFESGEQKELQYTTEVPREEIRRRIELLWDADKHDPKIIKPLLRWNFTFREYLLQSQIIASLVKDSRYDEFFDELLVDTKLTNICKKEIISGYIFHKKKDKIKVLINDIFDEYDISYPEQLEHLPSVFLEAYSSVFASLIFSLEDFEDRLLTYSKQFFDECKNYISQMDDASAISACMVYRGKLFRSDKKIRTACAVFNAKQTVVSYYNKLLSGKVQVNNTDTE